MSPVAKENVRNTEALIKQLREIKMYYVNAMNGLLSLEFGYFITVLFSGCSFLLQSQFTKSLGSGLQNFTFSFLSMQGKISANM